MPIATRMLVRLCAGVRLISVPLLALFPGFLHCQTWSSGSGGAIYYTGGNVGVGTWTPSQKLEVLGIGLFDWINSNATINLGDTNHGIKSTAGLGVTLFTFGVPSGLFLQQSTGNVGIGTAAPSQKLEVAGAGLFDWVNSNGTVNLGDTNHGIKSTAGSGVTLFTYGVPNGIFLQQVTGHVGIGTSSPQYSLSVNGTIQAKEVVVNTGWSDYVFESGYRLLPLPSFAVYIKNYHYLPDIPSAAEVKERGVSIGDMQAKLLAKVEELTLRLIQADDRISRLEQQNKRLLELNRPVEQPVAGRP